MALTSTVAWFGTGLATDYFLSRAAEQNAGMLRLSVAGLRGALNRYEPLPDLIADQADIKLLLTNPTDQAQIDTVNLQLKEIAASVKASDIYVMDNEGLTIAARNHDTETSFVGRNFSYRPYFTQAAEGGLGRYFALGMTSLKRGYYFARPVYLGSIIKGVVAVKINVASFEAAWRGGPSETMVTDDSGIVFMASRDAWRFASIKPLTPETMVAIKVSRQYPAERLKPLKITNRRTDAGGFDLIKIAGQGGAREYLAQTTEMPEAGWTVHLLSPTAGARSQAYAAVASAILVIFIAFLLIAFILQRRARLFERIDAQREARDLLEKRVDERTADLNEANEQLTREVAERTAAESELRKTQSDLVQAGKLAALGQMSAALSHEFNQPLAAVRSYADNAAAYLDRDRTDEARDNISRISQMTDRMAAISKHLRNFARKPDEKIAAVPIAVAINDAVEILSGKLKARSATVSVDLPEEELWVRGGQNRLQQVLVNLIANALDAMETTARR